MDELLSLFIIRPKIKMEYTSSRRKNERKVLNKDKKWRGIHIPSHVNSNLSKKLKSSNIDSVEIRITCVSSTLEDGSSSNSLSSSTMRIDN